MTTTSSGSTSRPWKRRVVTGDRLAQLRDPDGVGVAEHLGVEGLAGRRRSTGAGAGVEGCPATRLSRSPCVRRRLRRGGEEVHHVEGRHVGPARDGETLVHHLNLTAVAPCLCQHVGHGRRRAGAGDGRADGFAPVRDVFAEQVAASAGTGAAFAAWHDGRWVVDLWGGYADAGRTRPWARGHPGDALLGHQAVRGHLRAGAGRSRPGRPRRPDGDLLARAARGATVRQVLAHQPGTSSSTRPPAVDAFYDWDLMCGLLERQQPTWPPGTALGESALFYGHLLGQVVRRSTVVASARSCARRSAARTASTSTSAYTIAPAPGRRPDRLRRPIPRGTGARGRLMGRALANPPGALDPDVVNGTRWRQARDRPRSTGTARPGRSRGSTSRSRRAGCSPRPAGAR